MRLLLDVSISLCMHHNHRFIKLYVSRVYVLLYVYYPFL